jgi:hypothetical protein
MAQGTVKKLGKSKPGKANKNAKQSGVNKGRKAKTAADKLQRKFTAGMIAKTEKLLGERARHLELIGKGKKEDKKDDTKKHKGGSRKFG